MSPSENAKVEQLRKLFDGKEAIYIEKGALRVRVSHINGGRTYVSAEVEEVPTVGFPLGIFCEIQKAEPNPLHWSIGAADSHFSEHTWHAGYGGWSLFFAANIVEGILNLALRFPDDLGPFQRYREVLRYLRNHETYEPTQRFLAEP
jgi:hypothetical protein